MLELAESEKNLVLCFQSNTMSVDGYKRELKACVEVYESAGMRPGATEAIVKIVVEEENLATYSLTGDKLKKYLNKEGEQWCVKLHLLGINNTTYGELKQSIKYTWLIQ